MTNLPKVAPYESCLGCLKGDTTTIFVTEGEAEFHIAAISHATGMTTEEAAGTHLVFLEQELGCDPGKVPDGRYECGHRLCPDCAAKTGAKVFDIGTVLVKYRQPDEWPDE